VLDVLHRDQVALRIHDGDMRKPAYKQPGEIEHRDVAVMTYEPRLTAEPGR
jgi:hypothetical protein